MEGAAIDRFGDRHINILPLNMEQVDEFVNRWFRYVYSEGTSVGDRDAGSMINEVRSHTAIGRLIDNPLMLTAICILYHDGKELPGQRAELYKKFVDNLLHRRFDDPEKVHEYLKRLAFQMHSRRSKGSDRTFAIEVMMQTYKREDTETEHTYKKRIEALFDEIEPNSGLLKLEGGQYIFWHLTFQEFLTAGYIVDNSIDRVEAISQYWGDDWYNEVVELYIGFLSIENKKLANHIVENIVEAEDNAPFKKWLLASKSMIDIHKDRRENGVLDKSRKCLLDIIDKRPGPKILVEAGELLGWLGDPRDLKEFVKVNGSEYKLRRRTMKIDSFEIGKFPVTNSWFEKFINAGGYENKDYWSKWGWKWRDEKKVKHSRLWHDRKWRCPNSPVIGVSWYEADAFTRWLTHKQGDGYEYRLPDKNEWEAAASGLEGRVYPWANDCDNERCNSCEVKIGKTSPVGVFKGGETPDGIADLSGNVWEWTNIRYDEKKEIFDLCGGSWINSIGNCCCAVHSFNNPNGRSDLVGFRCARTLKL